MKHLFFCFLFFAGISRFYACQCPLSSLTNKELEKYDIIFKGSIKTIELNKSKSFAVFTVSELYKGIISQDFKVLFDDEDACKLELRVGDEWIIYSNYYQVNNAKLNFCSRSRKYIKNIKEDFFAETTGISYDEELRYLQTNLGKHKLLRKEIKTFENRNIIPNSKQFIIIILCSIIGLIAFYKAFNIFFKKHK